MLLSFFSTWLLWIKHLAGTPGSPVLHCTWQTQIGYGSAPLLVAEVLEQEGKFADAIKWALADLQHPDNYNVQRKARAGKWVQTAPADAIVTCLFRTNPQTTRPSRRPMSRGAGRACALSCCHRRCTRGDQSC